MVSHRRWRLYGPPEWELHILGGAFQSSLWQVWSGVLFLWLLFSLCLRMFGCFVFHSRFGVLLFLRNGFFPHRTEGGKCLMDVLPGRAIDAFFFDCMAVPVGVADLGALATDDLSCFAVTREMVFKFIASKTCFKFSVLFCLTLWRSYFGVKSVQAISDDGVSCFSVFTYNFNDVVVVFNLVYLDVVNVWVRSNYFVLDFNCWTVANVSAQSADKHRPLCRNFWRRDWCQVDFCQLLSAFGETSESMVDCMSDVTEKPPLFMSRIPVKKQPSLVWVISKMSSWVGLWSVSTFSLRVSRSLVVFLPPWGGASSAVFHARQW